MLASVEWCACVQERPSDGKHLWMWRELRLRGDRDEGDVERRTAGFLVSRRERSAARDEQLNRLQAAMARRLMQGGEASRPRRLRPRDGDIEAEIEQ